MRKKLIIFIALISTMLCVGITISAYFILELNTNNSHELSADSTDTSSVISINSISEFYQNIVIDSNSSFNATNDVSEVASRKTLKLSVDITLTADALVNRDCNLDLNGNAITLGSYDLIIKNQAVGRQVIYNGTIDNAGTGNVLIDCPNGHVAVTAICQKDVVRVEENSSQVLNSALQFVLSNIANHGINNFYSTITSFDNFGSKDACTIGGHTDGETTGCVYTYTDLDLLYNYLNYKNVRIEYTSNTPAVLTSYGRVILPETSTLVLFGIKLSYTESNGSIASLKKQINVHVLVEKDYTNGSISALLQGLYQKYYSIEESKYVIGSSFLLPLRDDYFETDFVYKLSATVSSEDESDYFEKMGEDYIILHLDSSIEELTIVSKLKSYTNEKTIAIKAESSKLIDDNYSYAVGIVADLYGNQIVSTLDTITNSYIIRDGKALLLTDINLNGYSRLDPESNIEYSLVNNDNNTYSIQKPYESDSRYDRLFVTEDKIPMIEETVYLSVKFTFKPNSTGTKDEIIVQIPIIYKPATSSGEGFEWFSPYYTYFNRQFITKTSNLTYSSFDVSLSYRIDENVFPTYTYLVYRKDDTGYTKISTKGELFNIKISNGTGVYLEDLVSTNSEDLKAYCSNNLSVTEVSIDPYYVSRLDTSYVFLYIPVTESENGLVYTVPNFTAEGTITGYTTCTKEVDIEINDVANYRYISELTIPGIVRCQTTGSSVIDEEFLDIDLYKLVYGYLHPETEYSEGKTFILSSRLSQSIDKIDIPALLTGNKTTLVSLKGVNLLTGLKKLTLTGVNIAGLNGGFITEIGYISQIRYLEELYMSNTGSYDRTSNTIGFPSGTDNNFIGLLSNLNNLKKLDLSYNKIYNFSTLTSLPALEEVVVTGNTFSCTRFTGFISFLNNIFTNIVNSIYGSSGATNNAYFSILVAKGVKVTGDSGTIIVSAETQKIINALMSLEYQDKLESGTDIADVWSGFNTSVTSTSNAFNLPYQYVEANGSDLRIRYTLKSISFSKVFETENEYSDTEFEFNITYGFDYSQRQSILGMTRWSDYTTSNIDDPNVTYSFRYSVSRY